MGMQIDLTGRRFGRLVAQSLYGKNKHRQNVWLCKCDCGRTSKVTAHNLLAGKTQSCGCLRCGKRIYGDTHKLLYGVYRQMKKRCLDESCPAYPNYGGRGISVCDEWLQKNGHLSFEKWALENGYERGLTLDRIDNDKGYSPDNCRWVTRKVQSNNKRNNVLITFRGKTQNMTQWAEEYNLVPQVVIGRIQRMHWTIEEALEIVPHKGGVKQNDRLLRQRS